VPTANVSQRSSSRSVRAAIFSEAYSPRWSGLEKVVPGNSSWIICIAVPMIRSTMPP
jgi:hypothetical protein